MFPTFIGIGAPKAGTTWLARCLDEHPDAFVTPVKETKFFDDDHIEGRRAEYEGHFAGSNGATAVGEISVRYLASKRGAAERIRQWIPDVRLFVSLRNPVDQIWSHYWHLLRQNFHQDTACFVPATVEDAIQRYPDLVLEPALYGKHLARWLRVFDRQQLQVIIYDDITVRPEAVIRDLYSFLGIDSEFCPPGLFVRDSSVRRGVSARTPWLGSVHRALYSFMQIGLYRPLKRMVGAWRAECIKNRLGVRQIMEGMFMRPGYPRMPTELRERLMILLAEDMHLLESLTGRSLSAWRQATGAEL
jgi:hypothetical protein